MGKFEVGDPTGLRRNSKAFNEIVYVGDVAQNRYLAALRSAA